MQWIEDPKSKQRVAPDQDGQSFVTPDAPSDSTSTPEHGKDGVLSASASSDSQGIQMSFASPPQPQPSPAESTTEAANSARSYPEVDSMGDSETSQPLETVSWIFHAFWIQTFFPFKHLCWKVMQAHMGVIRPHYILRKLPATMEASQTILNHILCLVSGSKFVAAGFNWDCHAHREANTCPVARGDQGSACSWEVAGSHLPGSKDLGAQTLAWYWTCVFCFSWEGPMFPIAVPFVGNHRPLWMFYQHIDMETNKISQYSMYIYMAPAIVKLVAWLFITIGDGIHWTPVLVHSLYFELRKQSVVLYWTSWIVSWGQASGHGADDRMSSDRPSHWGTGVGTVWDIGKSSLCIPLFRGKPGKASGLHRCSFSAGLILETNVRVVPWRPHQV